MRFELTASDIARFSSRVIRRDGCWDWDGAKRNGYGVMNIRGAVIYAHRIMYQLTHGEVPDGLFVLHECDNASCCRPDHLHLGTQRKNLAEMTERGRRRNPYSRKPRPVPIHGRDPQSVVRYRERQRAKRAMLPKVPCICGCGTMIPSINSMKQPARYAHGHNPEGERTRFEAGHQTWNAGVPIRPESKARMITTKMARRH